jgi:PKHD-type hydroxylase
MKSIYEIWDEVIPAAYCDHLVSRFEKYPQQNATIGFDGDFVADDDFRSSIIRWLDPLEADKDVNQLMMKYVKSANRNLFGADITSLNEIQFTEYHATQNGHYNWHQDVWWENPSPYDRKISIVIQLSPEDSYTGGEFEFFNGPSLDGRFTKQGSILVFPSFILHRVTPVTSGVRKSLVSWIEGPKWR